MVESVDNLSQERFDRLPLLLPLHVFCNWSGLSRKQVQAMRRDGSIEGFTRGRKYALYYKRDLAQLTGFRFR